MTNVTTSISITNAHLTLEQLLANYLSEKAESQRDDDTLFIQYWDSACQTIYDVAAALNIPLQEKSYFSASTQPTDSKGKRNG